MISYAVSLHAVALKPSWKTGTTPPRELPSDCDMLFSPRLPLKFNVSWVPVGDFLA